jgi:hypothetical protein
VTPGRLAGGAGTAWGLLLLCAGPRLWRATAGRPPSRGAVVAVRLLGLRHLAQGAAQVADPSRFRDACVLVDLVHSGSMLAVGARVRSARRPALLSAFVSATAAATTLLETPPATHHTLGAS